MGVVCGKFECNENRSVSVVIPGTLLCRHGSVSTPLNNKKKKSQRNSIEEHGLSYGKQMKKQDVDFGRAV